MRATFTVPAHPGMCFAPGVVASLPDDCPFMMDGRRIGTVVEAVGNDDGDALLVTVEMSVEQLGVRTVES